MGRSSLTPDEIEALRYRAKAAALRLYTKGGIAAITMRGIARSMGLSAMALYKYFPGGKWEILTSIRGDGFQKFASALAKAEHTCEDPEEDFRAILKAGVSFAVGHSDLYRWMYDTHYMGELFESDDVMASRRRAWQVIECATQRCIEAGVLAGDPKVLSHVFIAALHGAISFDLSNQPYMERRLDVLLEPLVNILFDGARTIATNEILPVKTTKSIGGSCE